MPYLDETRVFCAASAADIKDVTLSEAEWTFVAPITAPNPIYKMQAKLANATLPTSFQKVGPDRQNHKMSFMFLHEGEFDAELTKDEKAERCVDGATNPFSVSGIFTVELTEPVTSDNKTRVVDIVNKSLVQRLIYENWSTVKTDLQRTRWKPRLLYDSNFHTFTFAYFDWLADWVNSDGNVVRPMHPLGRADPSKYGYYDKPFEYKLITPADIDKYGITSLTKEDTALAEVLGFPDNYSPDFFGQDFNSPDTEIHVVPDAPITFGLTYNPQPSQFGSLGDPTATDVPVILGVCRAPDLPNLSGTMFIKIVSNLTARNVDPNSKAFRDVLACIPVSEGYEEDQVLYTSTSPATQAITLSQSKLDKIKIWLEDDAGRPLKPRKNWILEFAVSMEEPASLDVYRGINGFTSPAVDFHSSGDPGRYQRLRDEIQYNRDRAEAMETEHRERRARLT